LVAGSRVPGWLAALVDRASRAAGAPMIRAALLLAFVAGCGSVTPFAADAAPDAVQDAAQLETIGDSGAGGAGGGAGVGVDAGVDYGQPPGPRPVMPDGGWVGGVVGNCYDIACGDGSNVRADPVWCQPAGASADCFKCRVTAPGPACVAIGSAVCQNNPQRCTPGHPSFLVASCDDPKCR
jgi:hypothetical protein